ncbi:HIT family protein [Mollicutes bacterium LVI A0078]|nr:HIT family protein [Mollicutes bacterium LVI A0075]WOO91270.1 HIT family protein [Mollicutes bacterium LVI A0078]
MECVFCKIINNEIPKRSLYEDEVCEVIMDAFPVTEGHVLIVLKEHVESLDQASYETVAHVAKVVKFISNAMKMALNLDGITTVENSGLLQEIPHAHIHLIPTYENQRGLEFITKGNQERIEIEYQKILSRIQ